MRKHTRYLLITFLGCLLTNFAHSYSLKQIVDKEHLSNSAITSFCQDDKGVMWIGTCDGLNIYNGREVRNYEPVDEENYLSGNLIDKVLYSGDDTYWIKTYYGVDKYDAKKNKLVKYNEFRQLFFIEKDNNNHIFIIQESNSIYYYHKKSNTFKKIFISGVIFSDISKFFIDRKNTIWIVTNKGYSSSFKISENSKTGEITLSANKKRLHNNAQLLDCFYDDNCINLIDEKKDFFSLDIASGKETFVYNLDKEIQSRGKISSIIKYHDSFFVGFSMGGLILLEKPKNAMDYKSTVIDVNCGVFCLKKDRFQDIVWIGTDGQGVYHYTNTPYSVKSTLLNNIPDGMDRPIRALYLDEQKTLWIGSKGDGIRKIYNYDINKSILNSKIEKLTRENSLLSNNAVYCFAKSKRNILWIGNDEGVDYYSFRENKIKRLTLNLNGARFKYIHDIYEDKNSNLWIASVGLGVIKAHIGGSDTEPVLENIQHYSINNNDFASNFFFSIYAENDSTIWFANRGFGPIKYNAKTNSLNPINLYKKYNNQTANDVFSITKDEFNHYLFGTSFGLIKYSSSENSTIYNKKDGFLNNTVHAILKGVNNNYWLSTNQGLIVFDTQKDIFRIFDRLDGLEVAEFSDGAAFKDQKTGTLFFGGINGFVTVMEKNVTEQKFMPPIIFDKLSIFGAYYNILEVLTKEKKMDVLKLKHNQNIFSISFTAVDYLNGNNYNYYYKLEGLSDKWINNEHSNVASFTNLSPGNYYLNIKYYNQTLGKESPVYRIKIHINRPWYQSFLAYLFYLILLFFAVKYILRFLKTQDSQKKRELLNDIEKKHQKEMFESKLTFFTNIAHEFCTPLTLISGPCERILERKDNNKFVIDYVKMIKTNAERLNNLIQELIEFRRIETGNRTPVIEPLPVSELISEITDSFQLLAESKEISFDTEIDPSLIWNTDRSFITTIVTNLLSNAFKYTPALGNVLLKVSVSDINLVIQTTNDGKNIKDKDLDRVFDRYTILDNFENQDGKQSFSRTGLGLAISSNMIKILNGKIDVENAAGNKIIFTVLLPNMEIVENIPEGKVMNEYVPFVEIPSTIHLNEKNIDRERQTLLIIDDDIEMLWFVGEIFSEEYNIIKLQDSTQITHILNEVNPDLIICDVMMPNLNGIDLTKKIKEKKETNHIPIILISAKHEIEQQIEAISSGANIYITKPFNTEFLQTLVRQLLERQAKLKDYFSSPLSSFDLTEGKLTHKDNRKFYKTVLNIINENITDPELSTQFIATKLGMGSRSLYRKMKEIGAQSPSSLINDGRLFIAKDLLVKTTITIEEIVYKSGFSNRVSFFKAFNMKYNCTPKEYRMKNMENIQ